LVQALRRRAFRSASALPTIACAPVRTVCWRLSAWDPDIASVRYRAAIPAAHLADRGIESRFSAAAYGVLEPDPPDAIVFVKSFADRDVELAREAARAGVPYVLDVCDNVFAEGYRAHSSENLKRMTEQAAAVVTTGAALADVLRNRLGSHLPLHVVPDPVETPGDVRRAAGLVLRQRLGRALARRRADLPRAVAGIVERGLLPAVRRRIARPAKPRVPQVIWFGNSGSVQPRFGIINLADIARDLEQAAREVAFRLLVVTNDRAAYLEHVAPLALESAFAPWDRLTIFGHLRDSSVALVPNSRDEFSICKSANRASLALSQGTAVVATQIPSLAPLADCVYFDDFAGGLATYLQDRELAADHVRRAGDVIKREFSGPVVAECWQKALDGAG
jgi:glycosyltransferase involved in cell wall biosynthesis